MIDSIVRNCEKNIRFRWVKYPPNPSFEGNQKNQNRCPTNSIVRAGCAAIQPIAVRSRVRLYSTSPMVLTAAACSALVFGCSRSKQDISSLFRMPYGAQSLKETCSSVPKLSRIPRNPKTVSFRTIHGTHTSTGITHRGHAVFLSKPHNSQPTYTTAITGCSRIANPASAPVPNAIHRFRPRSIHQ